MIVAESVPTPSASHEPVYCASPVFSTFDKIILHFALLGQTTEFPAPLKVVNDWAVPSPLQTLTAPVKTVDTVLPFSALLAEHNLTMGAPVEVVIAEQVDAEHPP